MFALDGDITKHCKASNADSWKRRNQREAGGIDRRCSEPHLFIARNVNVKTHRTFMNGNVMQADLVVEKRHTARRDNTAFKMTQGRPNAPFLREGEGSLVEAPFKNLDEALRTSVRMYRARRAGAPAQSAVAVGQHGISRAAQHVEDRCPAHKSMLNESVPMRSARAYPVGVQSGSHSEAYACRSPTVGSYADSISRTSAKIAEAGSSRALADAFSDAESCRPRPSNGITLGSTEETGYGKPRPTEDTLGGFIPANMLPIMKALIPNDSAK